MTLITILIFGAAILFYRLVFQSRARGMVLLFVSALAVDVATAGHAGTQPGFLAADSHAGVGGAVMGDHDPAGRTELAHQLASICRAGGVVLAVALTRYLSLTGGLSSLRDRRKQTKYCWRWP